MTTATVLTIQDLRIRLGGRMVLGGVSLELARGTITAVLGANGAGKSTLLRAALGVLRPAAGRVRVLGRNPLRGAARGAIGYVPDEPDAYAWMSTRDLLRFVAPQHPGWDAERAREIVARLGVPLDTPLAELSRGDGAKAMLAAALAHEPALLLLDEPFSGLDPGAREALLGGILSEVRLERTAVLLATHDLDVVARVADRVALLAGGRLVASGTLAEVCGDHAPGRELRRFFHNGTQEERAA